MLGRKSEIRTRNNELSLATVPSARPPQEFRGDVEGLRGLAVLLVVGFHVAPQLISGGYVGVDVFFVISGYVIFRMLVREAEGGSISILGFFARRGLRLVPAAAVCIAVVVLACWLLYPSWEQREIANSALASLGYFSNVWYRSRAIDYLATEDTPNPLLHTWSLSVEEQFYLLCPLLVLLVMRVRRGQDPRNGLAVSTLALLGVSLSLAIAGVSTDRTGTYFATTARAWEFASGALVAVISSRATSSICCGLGLTAIVASALVFDSSTLVPSVPALLPVVGTLGVLTSDPRGVVAAALRLSVLRWLGRVSYSWYLWHWPAILIVTAVSLRDSTTIRTLAATAVLPVAYLSHRWIEQPLRSSSILQMRPWRGLAFCVMVIVLASGSVAWMRETPRDPPRKEAKLDSARHD